MTTIVICDCCLLIKRFGEFVPASPYILLLIQEDMPRKVKELDKIIEKCPDCRNKE